MSEAEPSTKWRKEEEMIAYKYFFSLRRNQVYEENPEADIDNIFKEVGEEWVSMTREQQQVYYDRSLEVQNPLPSQTEGSLQVIEVDDLTEGEDGGERGSSSDPKSVDDQVIVPLKPEKESISDMKEQSVKEEESKASVIVNHQTERKESQNKKMESDIQPFDKLKDQSKSPTESVTKNPITDKPTPGDEPKASTSKVKEDRKVSTSTPINSLDLISKTNTNSETKTSSLNSDNSKTEDKKSKVSNSKPVVPEVVVQAIPGSTCKRPDCTKPAIINSEMDDKFCSTNCCVQFCSASFKKFIEQRKRDGTEGSQS